MDAVIFRLPIATKQWVHGQGGDVRETTQPDYTVSEDLLARADFQQACADRDFARVFHLMRQWDHASQDRIAAPIEGMTQSRVSRIMTKKDRIATAEVMERVADGLHIPGSFLGLAPRRWENHDPNRTSTEPAASGASTAQRPPAGSVASVGELMDERLDVTLDVFPDGRVDVHQVHHLNNQGDTPVTGLTRQVWFKHTHAPIVVEATDSDRSVFIKTIHDVGVQVKFMAQIFPALNPGENAQVGYNAVGGQFADELYWRQTVFLPTKLLRLRLRLHG